MGGCRRRLNKNAERFPVARITQKRKKKQRRLGIGEHARERRGELFTPSVKPPPWFGLAWAFSREPCDPV